MYKCDICGREVAKKIRMGGYTLCSKHMHQLNKYGYFLDNNPRTASDLNDYRIEGDIAIFNLYSGPSSLKAGEFMIDLEDIERVKYHKWRFSHAHVVTGLPAKGTQRELSWVILGLDNRDPANANVVVDHISGDATDNRKCNLRIYTQSQNVLNKKSMSTNSLGGYIGVSYRKDRGAYDSEIKIDGKRCHLGCTNDINEAIFKRLIAEELVFKEFLNDSQRQMKIKQVENTIDPNRKIELINIVIHKLREKGLWQ